MVKRVLVTGGTGFVGSHIVETYLREGWTVRALVRDVNKLKWLSELNIEIISGSITDAEALDRAVKDCQLVIHCAGLTKALRKEDYYLSNSKATELLVLSAKKAGVKRFIYCSTHAAVGPTHSTNVIADENTRCNPITDYGKSKLAGEHALINNAGDMEWIILRPPSVMGPRDEQFIPLFKTVKKFGISPILGNGNQEYSFIFVKDLAKALWIVGQTQNEVNQIYFVANSQAINWGDVTDMIGVIAHKKTYLIKIPIFFLRIMSFFEMTISKITQKPALLSSDKIIEILSTGWVCSSKKIETELGFQCDYNLSATVKNTYDFYLEKKWI